MASIKQRPDGVWRARYRDHDGKEHARHFPTKRDGQKWLDEQTAALVTGTHIDPATARTTIREWSEVWLKGYARNRASTLRTAKTHINIINRDLGSRVMGKLRPSDVQAWVVSLQQQGYAPNYIHLIHARLAQLYIDAIHDGIVVKSPCSKRTAPKPGKQRPYVATTDQVWALYDAVPDHVRPAILLGAFAGLRVAEAVALRVEDVDFDNAVIRPAIQYPNDPLKTEMSKTAIPIPHELLEDLSFNLREWGSTKLVVNQFGRPCTPHLVARYIRDARPAVEGLSEKFGFHDLRHYFASLLIAAGLDIKTVQARMRHESAQTTLDTYGHLWPDKDESSRNAVAAVLRTSGGLNPRQR